MAPGGHSRRAGCGPCPTLTGGLEIGRGEIVFIRKQSVSPAPYPSSLSLLPCGFGFWGGFFFLSSQANLRILATKPGGACALPRGTAPAAPMPAGIPAPRCKPRDEPGEEAGAGPASQGRAADPTDPIGPRRPPPRHPGPPRGQHPRRSAPRFSPFSLGGAGPLYSQYVFLVSSSTTSGFNLLLDFPMVAAGRAVSPGKKRSAPASPAASPASLRWHGGTRGRDPHPHGTGPRVPRWQLPAGLHPAEGSGQQSRERWRVAGKGGGGGGGGGCSLLPGLGRKGRRAALQGRPACECVCACFVRVCVCVSLVTRTLPAQRGTAAERCGGAEGRRAPPRAAGWRREEGGGGEAPAWPPPPQIVCGGEPRQASCRGDCPFLPSRSR